MKISNFFGFFVLSFICFFLQSNDSFAQRSNTIRMNQSSKVSRTIDVSKLTVCKPNSYFATYVDFAKNDPNYNVMAVNVTLVSLWNHFTGQSTGQLRYDAKSCSFIGNLQFTFSDRFYQYPNCNPPSGGLNIAPQYPFNPKHVDKAKIRINATTGLVHLQLWGNKSFTTSIQKGIIHGFEKSANMMIAITAKKEQIPIIK